MSGYRAVSAGAALAAVLGALLAATPAPAQTASAQARADATIAAGLAITTRQDFVLGIVLLGLPKVTRSLALYDSGFGRLAAGLPAAGEPAPLNAAFVVTGDAGLSISIAIPPTIDLTRLGGSQTIRMATQADFGGADTQTLAPHGDEGVLAFNVGGRFLVDRRAVAGAYRGTLAATAQYN